MYICPYIFTGPGKTSIITMEIQAETVVPAVATVPVTIIMAIR